VLLAQTLAAIQAPGVGIVAIDLVVGQVLFAVTDVDRWLTAVSQEIEEPVR
jgi:hypothetical protein